MVIGRRKCDRPHRCQGPRLTLELMIEVGCLGCTDVLSDLEVDKLDENDCEEVIPQESL